MTIEGTEAESLFEEFTQANDLQSTLKFFHEMCGCLNLDPASTPPRDFYCQLKSQVHSVHSKMLWKCLDKRSAHVEYMEGKACNQSKAFVIGAGPCGLRMAIEAALLGAPVVVVEKRTYISRNNVLHIWAFVIADLKGLGCKVFHPQFCSGTLNHVSIRRLQLMLLKIALVLGVQVLVPVQFEHLVEPDPNTGVGWRAKVSPHSHPINSYEFGTIIGADGKQNTLPEFKRKCFRGRLAIGITANFLNHRTRNDAAVRELGGVVKIFNLELFNLIKEQTGMDLENIVYFKNETHYFVMCATRKCLLAKGIIKQNQSDPSALLAPDNIDKQLLMDNARDVAAVVTRHQLPVLEFATNHHDEKDVAIFDFTAMYQAEYSSYAKQRHGKRLLMSIVGDTLIEPFWPTGSGIARGFLGVYDAAWLMRDWYQTPPGSEVEILSRRETIYQMLSQTGPNTLKQATNKYTIDPVTRYGTKLKTPGMLPTPAGKLYDRADSKSGADHQPTPSPTEQPTQQSNKRKKSWNEEHLLRWFSKTLRPFASVVEVTDLDSSWENGLALCALVQVYRPQLLDICDLDENEALENTCLAFTLIEQEFGITPLLSAQDLVSDSRDLLALTSYLAQLQETLECEPLRKQRRVDSEKAPRQLSAMGMLQSLNYRDSMRVSSRPSLLKSLRHSQQLMKQSLQKIKGKAPSTKKASGSQKDLRRQLMSMQKGQTGVYASADMAKSTVKSVSRRTAVRAPQPPQPAPEDDGSERGGAMYTMPQRSESPERDSPAGASRRGMSAGFPSMSRQACAGVVGAKLQVFQQHEQPPPRQLKVLTTAESSPVKAAPEHDEDDDEPVSNVLESRASLQACQGVARARIAAMLKADVPSIPEVQEGDDDPGEMRPGVHKRVPASSEICCLCNKKMYIIERRSEYGYFFHRNCYKCYHCQTLLRVGIAVMKKQPDGSVRFYCVSHGYSAAGLDKVEWDRVGTRPDPETPPAPSEDDIFESLTSSMAPRMQSRDEADAETDDTGTPTDETSTEDDEEVDEEEETAAAAADDDDDAAEEEAAGSNVDDNVDYVHLAASRGRHDTSLQLIVADKIQHGLEEVASEEQELEEKGRQVEQSLRESHSSGKRRGTEENKLMTEWIDVMRRKKELVNKESKLMLQVRLMELKQRHLKLQAQLEMLGNLDDLTENLEELEEDTGVMETEMTELTDQLLDLRMYMKASKDTSV